MKNEKDMRKTVKQTAEKGLKGFTDEERDAMKERAKEMRKIEGKSDGESDALAKIAEMWGKDHTMAERIHALVKASAPELSAKTWYGMPAYAKDGNVICFFKPAQKFKTRYATLEFSDKANLDDGAIWPTAFALKELTSAEEEKIATLVKKAVG